MSYIPETTFYYTPYWIRRLSNLNYGDTVSHEDFNEMFNLNELQGDYNTEVLRLLLTQTDPVQVPHIPYLDSYVEATHTDIENLNNRVDVLNEEHNALVNVVNNHEERMLNLEDNERTLKLDVAALQQAQEDLTNTVNTIDDRISSVENLYNTLILEVEQVERSVAELSVELDECENRVEEVQDTLAADIVSVANDLNNRKQDKLTAGANITIDANNVISATGGGGGGTYIAGRGINISGSTISSTISQVYYGNTVPSDSLGEIGDIYFYFGGEV